MTGPVCRLALALGIIIFLWGELEVPVLLKVPAPCVPQGLTSRPDPPVQPALAVPEGQPAAEPAGSPKATGVLSPASGTIHLPRTPVLANLVQLMEMDMAIKKHARAFGVDENLVWAVIRQESGFNPAAVSPKGAMGLMQLMPGTAASLGVTEPFDVEQNIAGGIKYLERCLNQFDGNVALALAAYNAGPENVTKYQGCPPFPETRQYVAAVLQHYGRPPAARIFEVKAPKPAEARQSTSAPGGSGLLWNLPAPVVKTSGPTWLIPQPRWKVVSGDRRLPTITAKAATARPSPGPKLEAAR